MKIGVPKEIKISESRVGLTESGVNQLVAEGHSLYVQKGAGIGSQISDEDYTRAGAKILDTIQDIYATADMIIKVKEPLPDEYDLLREEQILYTYLHLAAEAKLTKVLVEKKVKAVAYETIESADGGLPLLTPMSEVAGRLATQVGAFYLQTNNGSLGVLLGGVTGVKKEKVTIIGGGVVGRSAAKMAIGLGADVTVLDVNRNTLENLDHMFNGNINTLYSNYSNIEACVRESSLVVGAVLLPGRKAPNLVTKEMISQMQSGSVVVDVAVDQGGCIETCRPTSHKDPIYEVDGVIHYCVPNMPGIVARTSTYALTNATFKYGSMIAQLGVEAAIAKEPLLETGLNVYKGHITYAPVAQDLGLEYRAYKTLI